MDLLLLLSIAAMASSAAADADQCADGVSFWCQSLATAEACDAVEHCKENVWNDPNLEEEVDVSDSCSFCKVIVSDARKLQAEEKTEDDVKLFLNAACEMLPEASVASQCKQLVAKKTTIDVIHSELEPQVVCRILGVCRRVISQADPIEQRVISQADPIEQRVVSQAEQIEQILRQVDSQTGNSIPQVPISTKVLQPNSCPDCQKFFTALKTLLSNESPNFFQDVILDQICPRTAAFKKQCEDLVKMYLPSLFQFGANLLKPDQVCKEIKMCKKSEDELEPLGLDSTKWNELLKEALLLLEDVLPQQPIDIEDSRSSSCPDCTKYFTSLKNILGKEAPPFFQDLMLDTVCPTMAKYQKQCEDGVKMALPMVFQTVVQYFDPNRICKQIKMCPKNLEDLQTLKPEDFINLLKESLNLTNFLQPTTCTDCNKFFTTLKSFIQNEATALVQDVLLDQVCTRTGSHQKQCEEIVKTYFPALIRFALNFLNPDTVCKAMKMCPRSQRNADSDPILMDFTWDWEDLDHLIDRAVGQTTACSTCKTSVQFIQSFIDNPLTKSLLKKGLCFSFHGFRQLCEDTVDRVLDLVVKFLDPVTVCRVFRLCPKMTMTDGEEDSFSSPSLDQVLQGKAENIDCLTCETAVRLLLTFIDIEHTEGEIIKSMLKYCGRLPETFVGGCRNLVTTYGTKLIDAIRAKLQPHEICSKLHLCSAFSINREEILEAVVTQRCVICQSAFQYLEAYLDQNETVAMIQLRLKPLCHALPRTLEDKVCLPVVDKYIPPLVHQLTVLVSPKRLCTKVKLCADGLTSEVVSMETVQSNVAKIWRPLDCLLGRSFWCASKANAKLCKAVEFCDRYLK